MKKRDVESGHTHTKRFQIRFPGWVLRPSSQARTAISLAASRSITSTSNDQKHQHQYFPYLFGFSWWSNLHTCHFSPPSIVTSTRVTFLPPPAYIYDTYVTQQYTIQEKHTSPSLNSLWLTTYILSRIKLYIKQWWTLI